MDVRPSVSHHVDFLAGGGEMERRIRAHDWSRTSLGPLESWPQSLKTALKIALNSRYPIWLGWGPDLIFLYNDPYIPITGKRHEWALGTAARHLWKEIWEEHLEPQAEAVMCRGEASWNDQRQLIMYRNGYAEETYFTFSFSPLPTDEGGIGGLFCACTEDTQKVLGERRLATLRQLATATAEARTEKNAADIAVRTLADHNVDVSFALLYLLSEDGAEARVAASTPQTISEVWAPLNISLGGVPSIGSNGALQRAMREGKQVILAIDTELGLPGGRWPEPATVAAVMPLAQPGGRILRGFLVVGASPRLPFDNSYESFFELLARSTANSLSNARAYEEEKRRAESLAELDRAKTAFFSNVSHEFRTPLTLMLSPVEELLDKSHTELSPSAKSQLEVVNRNGMRLLRLVNSLLDFSRIEAGRVHATYEAIDLAAFTAELASSFRSTTERAGLQLVVDCPSLTEPVYVDRDMWEKIVLNLLSNAFKFTFDGKIEVSLSEEVDNTRPSENPKDTDYACSSLPITHPLLHAGSSPMPIQRNVILRVQDTGVGISADAMPHMFERFYRVEHVRSRTYEGSGIGLALVQELVKLHGGSVRVESVLGHGSTFIVTLPFGTAHLHEDRIVPGRVAAPTAMGSAPFVEEALQWLNPELIETERSSLRSQQSRSRVLVADDNADMRNYISRLLSDRFEVVRAVDGQDALERIRVMQHEGRLPELVLSDIMMPRLDGFGLLRTLRTDPDLKSIPIILLSARAGEESRIEGVEAGADDYLIKPFSAKELLARVESHVKLAALRCEADRALRESERQFRETADTAPAILWVTEADGSCSFLSRGWFDFTGQTEAEGLGIGWLNAVHPEDREKTQRVFLDANKRHEPFVLDYRLRRSNGGYSWCIDSGRPRFDKMRDFIGYVGSVIDITERKQAEEGLREAHQRLERWNFELEQTVHQKTAELQQSQARLRGLARELNLAEQRERKRLATELHDHLQQLLVVGKLAIGQATKVVDTVPLYEKVLKRVDEVLSEALIYSRTLVAELSPPVLREQSLDANLHWLAEYMKQKHNLTVTVMRSKGDRVPLTEDENILLFQSVRELLINSAKYAQTGAATVTVEYGEARLSIVVGDQGKGFDLAAAAAAVEAPCGGISSKFGLFSIQERMRALGGSFEIDSTLGQGTLATLVLPLAKNFQDSDKSPTRSNMRDERTERQEPIGSSAITRVLLVDDHMMVRQGLRAVLDGYQDITLVGEAANGEDAVRLVEQLHPEVVVMDINMPRMNGIEATHRIKEAHPYIQVIGLSVDADTTNQRAMLQAGAKALLSKESAAVRLYDAICSSVSSSRA